MKSGFWIQLMNGLVMIFIFLMVVTFLTLPFLVDQFGEVTGVPLQNPLMLKVFLYLTAVPFFLLLIMVKRLCNNILRGDPFSRGSISALHIISLCAFLDFLLYAIGTFFILRNMLSLTLMVAAFMVGLTGYILSHLVRVAMKMKQENDLTI